MASHFKFLATGDTCRHMFDTNTQNTTISGIHMCTTTCRRTKNIQTRMLRPVFFLAGGRSDRLPVISVFAVTANGQMVERVIVRNTQTRHGERERDVAA